MRFAAAGFVVALLAAPLAARAAESPARFAATLQASVSEELTYEQNHAEEECLIHRTGSGGRQLTIRSGSPTRIAVLRSAPGAVYRPARIAEVRIAGRALGGTFAELRRCRGAPFERLRGECDAISLPVRSVREPFQRPARNALRFRAVASRALDVQACGLGRLPGGDVLQLALGKVDENALLTGRSSRVIARGAATRAATIQRDAETTMTQRTTVRWTLTFRRLS